MFAFEHSARESDTASQNELGKLACGGGKPFCCGVNRSVWDHSKEAKRNRKKRVSKEEKRNRKKKGWERFIPSRCAQGANVMKN